MCISSFEGCLGGMGVGFEDGAKCGVEGVRVVEEGVVEVERTIFFLRRTPW